MASRSFRRFVFLAVVFFFVVGLYFVDQRPVPSSNVATLLHDIVMGPPLQMPELELHNDVPECAILTPQKGFVDLLGLSASAEDGKAVAWPVRAPGLAHNYSIGICLSPLKKLLVESVSVRDGVDASHMGAFYVDPSGEYVLMGQVSSRPEYHGHRLTLTYENGSFCNTVQQTNGEKMRQKTILTFMCDHQMMGRAHITHLASAEDCTHVFEVRSHFACATAAKADNLAAVWIFLLIFLAALMVFFSGEVLYRHLKRKEVVV